LCSARFFALADSSGKSYSVETDGVSHWIREGIAPHTNHFIDPNALSREGRLGLVATSERRRRSAVLVAQKSKGSVGKIFSALAFNDGTVESICQLGEFREDRTCASFIIDPLHQTLSFSPCPTESAEQHTVGFE
jgi:hypothetical protein